MADPTTERDVLASYLIGLHDDAEAEVQRRSSPGGQTVGPGELSAVPLSVLHRLVRETARLLDGSQVRYTHDVLNEATARAEKAEAKIARLVEAGHRLSVHAQHDFGCASRGDGCSCGLAAARTSWAAAKYSDAPVGEDSR